MVQTLRNRDIPSHLGSRLARVHVKDATHREANLLALRPIHKNQRVVDDSPDDAVFVLHNLYPEAFGRLRVRHQNKVFRVNTLRKLAVKDELTVDWLDQTSFGESSSRPSVWCVCV